VTLVLVLTAAGSIRSIGGIQAYLSDTETAVGNTFVAATWNNPFDIYKVSGDGKWDGTQWIVSMYAKERKSTTVTFANYSNENITISLAVSPASQDSGNLTFGFDTTTLFVPTKERASVVFWVETSQSVTPGTYSTIVTVEKEG